jgi:hypothetical protein
MVYRRRDQTARRCSPYSADDGLLVLLPGSAGTAKDKEKRQTGKCKYEASFHLVLLLFPFLIPDFGLKEPMTSVNPPPVLEDAGKPSASEPKQPPCQSMTRVADPGLLENQVVKLLKNLAGYTVVAV